LGPGIRESLSSKGYNVETVDLRNWLNRPAELYEKLQSKDVIWICGGHTYYLSWILKESGADNIIKELVTAGKVYAGWSAGAIVAGPTTKFFNLMGDDPTQAPEIIYEGLGLTDIVIVPHTDNADFAEGAAAANEQLLQAGFKTMPLKDNQAYIIHGEEKTLV
jgi:dipeptidase E